MYCFKCGTKQEEGEKFCPKCGTPFIVVDTGDSLKDSSASESAGKRYKSETKTGKSFKERFKDNLCLSSSFFIPLLGIVLYFMKRKKNKKLANKILIFTAIGIVFNTAVFIYNHSNDASESDYDLESSYEAENGYGDESRYEGASDNNDEFNYDEESGYGGNEYAETEERENDLWRNYVGKWVHVLVLKPDEYSNVAGYGGSVYLTINSNGTAHLKLTFAEVGYERVVIDSTGDIEMDGNILILHLNGGSPKFILKDNYVYTFEGERMKKDY